MNYRKLAFLTLTYLLIKLFESLSVDASLCLCINSKQTNERNG